MAAVALANGLNANMLRKWVNEARLATASPPPVSRPVNKPSPTPPVPGFVALRLPEPAPRADLLPNIHLEVQRKHAANTC
jgi:transposase-like protein